MRSIAVYGASGFGREVMPLVRAQYADTDTQLYFVDDGQADDRDILSFDAFSRLDSDSKYAVIAIANSSVRESLSKKCIAAGIAPLQVCAGNAIILDDVEIGEGSVLCGFTHLTSNIRIGKYFHLNLYSYVAHDCVIGDYVTFAPGVKCNGNVHIGDHAYIGTGAIVKPGTPDAPRYIGRGAVVGMGAVVTKDVPDGAVVMGNPARPLPR